MTEDQLKYLQMFSVVTDDQLKYLREFKEKKMTEAQRKNVEKMIQFLESFQDTENEKFNMGLYGLRNNQMEKGGRECGTMACAMGWAGIREIFSGFVVKWKEYPKLYANSDEPVIPEEDLMLVPSFHGEDCSFNEIGRQLFGMSEGQYCAMFCPHYYSMDSFIERERLIKKLTRFLEDGQVVGY